MQVITPLFLIVDNTLFINNVIERKYEKGRTVEIACWVPPPPPGRIRNVVGNVRGRPGESGPDPGRALRAKSLDGTMEVEGHDHRAGNVGCGDELGQRGRENKT